MRSLARRPPIGRSPDDCSLVIRYVLATSGTCLRGVLFAWLQPGGGFRWKM